MEEEDEREGGESKVQGGVSGKDGEGEQGERGDGTKHNLSHVHVQMSATGT